MSAPPAAAPASAPGAEAAGRPARAEARILAAAVEQLAATGFSGLTVEAVALAAGVGRATIYRHWATKADLVMAAVRSVVRELPQPDSGSLREDLVELATALAGALAGTPFGAVFPAIVEASAKDPEFAVLHDTLVEERRSGAHAVLARAVARGEVAPGTDAELLLDLLVGPLFYRHLVLRQATSPAQVRWLAEGAVAAAGVRG